MLLAVAQKSKTMQLSKSSGCLVVLVEPWMEEGSQAEDDGVRLTAGVHELHRAYLQLLRYLEVPYVSMPAMSVDTRLETLQPHLQSLADHRV